MALSIGMSRTRSWTNDLPWLIGALAVASALELVILRLFTRTAVHIPVLEHLQTPYAWLSEGGRFAYFVAIALLLPGLLLLAIEFGKGNGIALSAVLLFTSAAALAAAGASERAVVDLATITAVGVLAAVLVAASNRKAAAAPALFGASFAASGIYVALPSLGTGWEAQPQWLLTASEYTGLGFALTSPLLLTRTPSKASRWVGIGVLMLVLAVFLGNGSTSRFLLLWNVGLPGSLPAVFYAAAAGALALAMTGLIRSGRTLEAAGLLLLVTGGIGLHNTYQSGLVIAGLGALYCAARSTTREEPAVPAPGA